MLCDRIGAGKTIIGGSIFLGFAVPLFYFLVSQSAEWLFLPYVLAGLSVGIVGAESFVLVTAFLAVVHFSGLLFSYIVCFMPFLVA